MKKIFSAIIAVAITTMALAQSLKDVSLNTNAPFKGYSFTSDDPGGLEAADINAKAIMHFNTTYKNVSDVQWSVVPDGYMVFFSAQGNTNRVFYGKHGNWKFSVSYYGENKLPKEIRSQVKSVYYDFAIKSVQEINLTGKTVYLVYIEGDNSSKQLKLSDGEMEVVKDFQNVN